MTTGEKTNLPFLSRRCQEKISVRHWSPDLRLRPATHDQIKKGERRTQASLIYLKKNGAKDYKTKAQQEFLRQEEISHDVTERCYPRSNELSERLNLTIMENSQALALCCISCSGALEDQKSPNDP
jgi:hypothetical protein